ncbi:nicotinate phosphoribosyltransferase [Kyrpidia tusciae]|uniref:Nicotinate phosphoribosyltransferase n=1 Tax=Kyrpidia tusciae (strain DSM 2912 / NBRC 15312 / T2) TaxID=562970 RepID=D5WUJ3_KYRT2|nr:nicotinate phosphoribosyltransferase [Kyrpidia tusciae]ADG05383.1 nicotinate phosphoribosyltransferase [Kyrpidia tusciae DSM 2912]
MSFPLLFDFYELTMAYGYFRAGIHERTAVFDLFYRKGPFEHPYVLFVGLEGVLQGIENFGFGEDEIRYLQSVAPQIRDEQFWDLLRRFRFHGTIYAPEEGTVMFPREPMLRVEGKLFEVQLLETMLLTYVNHQSLIATAAHRMVEAAAGKPVIEMGARRAQGVDAAIDGARAAYIGGVSKTATTEAGRRFGIPITGTMAHSFVLAFHRDVRSPDQAKEAELQAFTAYAEAFPDQCLLVVDTTDVERSGLPNAITVFRKLREKGYEPIGVRIDSGDLAYLSRVCRKALDEAGFPDAQIIASSDLDEFVIRDLLAQGAPIDAFGVGTNLITARSDPALGGVYKLAAIEWEENGERHLSTPIKLSENPTKVTLPGRKNVVRLLKDGQFVGDLIMLEDEEDPKGPLRMIHPEYRWKQKVVTDYEAIRLLRPVYRDGRRLIDKITPDTARQTAAQSLAQLSPEHRRLHMPHEPHVDLSDALYERWMAEIHRRRMEKVQ